MTKKSGFYEKNPGTDVSVEQMIVKTTNNSRGIRLGNFVQIRDVIDEELEAVWAGKKTAKEGARRRGQARQRADRPFREDGQGAVIGRSPDRTAGEGLRDALGESLSPRRGERVD